MIAVAKCRTGFPCRYHGLSVGSPALIKKLRDIEPVFVCPECEAGFPIPRPPIRKRDGKIFLGDENITEKITTYCNKKSRELKILGVKLFIGVKGSPCCDPGSGTFAQALAQEGITTRLTL